MKIASFNYLNRKEIKSEMMLMMYGLIKNKKKIFIIFINFNILISIKCFLIIIKYIYFHINNNDINK